MQYVHALMLSVLVALGAGQTGTQGSEPLQPTLRAVRFYRGEAGMTRVKVLVGIPYAMLTPSGPSDSTLTYDVGVRIADASGLVLHTDAWRGHVSAGIRDASAVALEILDFQVGPGQFTVEVTVTDSASGARQLAKTEVEGFATMPMASDLLLSPAIRQSTAEDTLPEAGELAFGQGGEILVAAAPSLILTPLRPEAYYLLEVYAKEATTGWVTLGIVDQAGRTVVQTQPGAIDIQPGGRILTGEVNLTGLPPGTYRMNLDLAVGGQSLQRSLPFEMTGLQETLQREAARRQADLVTDAGYFGAMSPEQLREAWEPLAYVAEPSDRLSGFEDALSVGAQRAWLTQFWERRDPDPATPRNEARERFYDAIAFANEHYRERGRSGRAGWRTDRGRVFARHGAPGEVLSRPSSGRAPPYVVWRYTRGKERYYIFVDRTSMDSYTLICSNDLAEPCRGDWRETIGEDAVRDIGQFLGVNFYRGQVAPIE